MAKTITVTTKITFVDCEDLTVEDVTNSINKTEGIYLHLIDRTVNAKVELVEVAEKE